MTTAAWSQRLGEADGRYGSRQGTFCGGSIWLEDGGGYLPADTHLPEHPKGTDFIKYYYVSIKLIHTAIKNRKRDFQVLIQHTKSFEVAVPF